MFAGLQTWMRETVQAHSVAEQGALVLERRRMYVLFAIALFKLMNFFGGNWDIQWHVAIGRDSLFIPPHLMVMVAFTGGIVLAWFWICYETFIVRADLKTGRTVRVGMLQAPPAFFGVFAGYAGAFLSAIFDEAWHRAFGIDSTLWSPPHLCILASTMLVDYSLMIGITTTARWLGDELNWRRLFFWGLGLTGAYMFEAVNFQMSQSFVEAYRVNGVGLWGILFPILVGAVYPVPMLFTIKIAKRFSVVLLVFAIAMVLQIIGIGIAAAGFALLQPVSVIPEFIRLNPDSAIAKSAGFIIAMGFGGLAGIEQTWSLALSTVPLMLVALLNGLPWARRHWIVAAPVFSASLVIVSFVMMQQIPLMRGYAMTWLDVLLGTVLATLAGLFFGAIGLRLTKLIPDEDSTARLSE